MNRGKLYVDGYDAYRKWGIYVVKGGWNELIAYPPLKSVDFNDWQEIDGIEPDLEAPQLDTREAQLKIAFNGGHKLFWDFIRTLSDGAYHDFRAASIGRRFRLRLTQVPSLDCYGTLGFVSIKFCDDFPLDGYTYRAPKSTMPRVGDYLIDGAPLTDYGCRILQGTLAEILKPAQVKQNMLRNVASLPGAIYDGKTVTFKSKDIKLRCFMTADTLDDLWRNYDALLFDLTRPYERILEVAAIGDKFPVYYKNASVQDFYPSGKIWLEYSITLSTIRNPVPRRL